MKNIFFLIVCMLTQLTRLHAQEFWLQPDTFFYQPGEYASVNFNLGENFIGTPVDLSKDNIQKLEASAGLTSINLKDSVKANAKTDFRVTLPTEGSYRIVLQRAPEVSVRDGDAFNTYLKQHGLDDAYYHREKNGLLAKPGHERTTCFATLLIQAGSKQDEGYKKKSALPLEIILQKDPATIKVGDLVKFQLFFEGRPLFGAKVNVWNRGNNRTLIQPAHTLQDGTIEARISNTGVWMVSVVKMVRSKTSDVEWESYRHTLVFGVR
jgi:uncharacterized GH25 family protein